MKKTFFLIITSLLTSIVLHAQQPWQKITDAGTIEIAANFKNPPARYGMILWWGLGRTGNRYSYKKRPRQD